MGCRYCMVSCPFDVPRFEYGETNPRILKCQLCHSRVTTGEIPACAGACPMGAIQFGTRSALLREARSRMAQEPERYVDHIYGEHEVGGTSVLYLSAVPFEQLGFRTDLGDRPSPESTKEFLYAVPFVLTILPVFLAGLSQARRAANHDPEEPDHDLGH